jgi:hypothetical protein
MVSDSKLWWDKYYKGNTKQYLDSLLSQNNPQGTKTLAINQRQIYDRFPQELKWNEEEERSGTAYGGVVLNYFTPSEVLPVPTILPEVSKKPDTVFQPDPSVNMGLSIIPTASAEPEPISLPSVYGAQYVPDVVLQRPGELYSSLGQNIELSESVEYKRVKVIDISTGIVAFDGYLTVESIKLHQDDPRYTVEFAEPEPEQPPEPITTCIDVYRLSNGSVTTTRETVSFVTFADYVNVQHLLVRECGQPVPTTQEVKTWYGYFEPEPEPEPEPTVGIPGKFNTNILVGLLAGGLLAVPILDDLLKTKKKRRR